MKKLTCFKIYFWETFKNFKNLIQFYDYILSKGEKRMFKIFILIITSLTFFNCAELLKKPRISFPIEEYQNMPKASEKMGTAIIKGQAFLKTKGGDVKLAAGNQIELNPVTSYSNQWYNIVYLNDEQLKDPDARVFDYIYKTQADAGGNFKFTKIPSGKYYLTTSIIWQIPSNIYDPQYSGGLVSKKITVNDNDSLDVILTR